MKKTTKLIIILAAAALLLTACRKRGSETEFVPQTTQTETPAETRMTETGQDTETETPPATETTSESSTPSENSEENNDIAERLEGLTENQYDGLEITAAVLERKAILPGSTIPLTVTITNTGKQKVLYTLGSGSFLTPQALIMDVSGLQPILPGDHLGAATMDIRTQELLPGEHIQHILYIKAIEPNEKFNDYTYDNWEKNEQAYIGDAEWDDLSKNYPDLVAAGAGTYEGTVYFLYYLDDESQQNATLSPTGYSTGDFTISVTE